MQWYDPQLYDSDTRSFLADEVDFYTALAQQLRPRSILELGVGTGRVLSALLGGVERAAGIDISQPMLDACRRRCGDRSGVRLIRGDFRHFQLGETFDLVYVPFNTFQHLARREDQKSCCASIRAHLAPNGHVVLDLLDLQNLAVESSVGKWYRDYVTRLPDGNTVTRFRATLAWNAERQVARKLIGYTVRDGDRVLRVQRMHAKMALFSLDQIRALAAEHGLQIVRRWSDYRFGEDPCGEKMILLLRARDDAGEEQA